eukprot:339542_1
MDSALLKDDNTATDVVIESTKHSSCRQFFGGLFFLLIILPLILVLIIITLPIWIYWSIQLCCKCCCCASPYNEKDLIVQDCNQTKKVLFLLPQWGFDPTEASVPWYIMTKLYDNIQITFATPTKQISCADKLVLSGYVFGFIKASSNAVKYTKLLVESDEFKNPIAYKNIVMDEYDGIFIPGGHDPQVVSLTKNKLLTQKLKEFVDNDSNNNKPIAAICHGVQLLHNSDILKDVKVTAVCSWMERVAVILSYWQYGGYHLSTTDGSYLQEQIGKNCKEFVCGSKNMLQLIVHGSMDNHTTAFIVEDNRFVTARFPGDAYLIAKRFVCKLYHQ